MVSIERKPVRLASDILSIAFRTAESMRRHGIVNAKCFPDHHRHVKSVCGSGAGEEKLARCLTVPVAPMHILVDQTGCDVSSKEHLRRGSKAQVMSNKNNSDHYGSSRRNISDSVDIDSILVISAYRRLMIETQRLSRSPYALHNIAPHGNAESQEHHRIAAGAVSGDGALELAQPDRQTLVRTDS